MKNQNIAGCVLRTLAEVIRGRTWRYFNADISQTQYLNMPDNAGIRE